MAEQRGSAQYEASYQATLAEAGRVPSSARTSPGVCGEWSLKDLMGHLAFWDDDLAEELEAKRDGRTLLTSGERDWQSINIEQAALRSDWTWDQIMTGVELAHDRLAPLLVDPGENPDDEPIHSHWNEHRAQIEAWNAAQGHWPPREPDPPENARDEYVKFSDFTLELIGAISEPLRQEAGVCGDWSLKDLLGHLAFWDGRVVAALEARKAGQAHEADRRSYDLINAEAARARADLPWDEIAEEVAANRERLLPLLIDPGEADDYKIYMHWKEHGAQIEAWAAAHSHV